MTLYEILIPQTDNNGKEFPYDLRQKFLKDVAILTGGFTLPSAANIFYGGFINSEGELIVETMSPMRIATGLDTINNVLELVATTFDQESVMFYEVADNAGFYSRHQ